MIPLWSAPYAVATGNTVVIKPSSEVPFSQTKITELAEEAGFPPGVWNMVHGGRTVVGGMLEHPDIKGITFVGSTPVMKDVIYPGCGETGKRCIAQGGAANIIVIMPDCNVEATIPGLMTSFFGNAGRGAWPVKPWLLWVMTMPFTTILGWQKLLTGPETSGSVTALMSLCRWDL